MSEALQMIEQLEKEDRERFPEFHNTINKGGDKIMATIKEEALAYESKSTLNIADLNEVTTDLTLLEEKGINTETNEPYTYKYVELNDQRYRVPWTVLDQLKAQLEANPNLAKFKVKKDGQGKATKYMVVPITA